MCSNALAAPRIEAGRRELCPKRFMMLSLL
jgi:hypothetical protein